MQKAAAVDRRGWPLGSRYLSEAIESLVFSFLCTGDLSEAQLCSKAAASTVQTYVRDTAALCVLLREDDELAAQSLSLTARARKLRSLSFESSPTVTFQAAAIIPQGCVFGWRDC